MALTKRGKWWYADTTADLEAYLLTKVLAVHQKRRTHLVVHATCAGCGGTRFDLYPDDETRVLRECTACQNEHRICDPVGEYDDSSASEMPCPCMYTEAEVAVGFAIEPVTVEDAKTGEHQMPAVRYIYVAGRCTHCDSCGIWGEWRVRRFHTPEQMSELV